MRIVSLIASATEIVCALGYESSLVGRSHECDFPPTIRDLLRPSRGHHVRVHPKECDPVDMVLIRGRQIRRDSLQDTFSLSFKAPETPALEQGTYAFEHPRMGTFHIFIVPYQQGGGHRYYEATFSLLLRPLKLE